MVKWITVKDGGKYQSFLGDLFNKLSKDEYNYIQKNIYNKKHLHLVPSRMYLNKLRNKVINKSFAKGKKFLFYNELSDDKIGRILSRYSQNEEYHLIIHGLPNKCFGKLNAYLNFLDVLRIKDSENKNLNKVFNNYKFNEWTKLYKVNNMKKVVYYNFGLITQSLKYTKHKKDHNKLLKEIEGVKIWIG